MSTLSKKPNPQRVIKTGDIITLDDGRKMKVHYVVEKDGQYSFLSPLGYIDEVIVVPDGEKAVHIKPNQIVF